MAKHKKNKSFTYKYRAVCLDCDFTGKWRDTEPEAGADKIEHQYEEPTHEVDVEKKQITN